MVSAVRRCCRCTAPCRRQTPAAPRQEDVHNSYCSPDGCRAVEGYTLRRRLPWCRPWSGALDTISESHSLSVLGISALEERIYRFLVTHDGRTLTELMAALALGKRTMVRGLEHLELNGLVRHSPEVPRRYFAAPPDLAIEALILKRQESLQRARVTAQALQDAAAAGRAGGGPEQMVELIASREGERLVFEQLYIGATQEVVTLMRLPMRVSRMEPPYDVSPLLQARQRAVRFRTIVDGDYLNAPGGIGYLNAEIDAGVEAREVPHLPFKLVMADRRVAIIPLKLEQSDSHILVVRSSALLDALYALFEILWQRGAPVGLAGDGGAHQRMAGLGLDVHEEALLELLALGMNDKAIAHELSISQRTLERRVAAILRALGARTRFQAGFLLGRLLER